MKDHRCPARRNAGFILIYVAAILIFLTGLVLHSSREVRGDAQVSARLQEQTAGRDRLLAAAALLRARLAYRWDQAAASERNMSLFFANPLDRIEIDGVPISLSIEDAELRPDVNLLGAVQWARLLGAYGMAGKEAERQAAVIDSLRQKSGGFESIVDLAEYPNMPSSLVRGFDAPGGEHYPALVDLLTASGASQRLQVANSPLPLFISLLNASPEQLGRLQEIRRLRPATLADAQLIFGSEALKICYEGEPVKLRARLEIDQIPLRLEIEMSARNGQLVVSPPRILSAA